MGNKHTLAGGIDRLEQLRCTADRMAYRLTKLHGRLNDRLTAGDFLRYLSGRGEVLLAMDGYGGWRHPRPTVIETERMLRDIGHALDEFLALFSQDSEKGPIAARLLLIARMRDTVFVSDDQAWLFWCRERFCIQRRRAYTLLAAGRLLARHGETWPYLYSVAPAKLEMVWALPEVARIGVLQAHDLSLTTGQELAGLCRTMVKTADQLGLLALKRGPRKRKEEQAGGNPRRNG